MINVAFPFLYFNLLHKYLWNFGDIQVYTLFMLVAAPTMDAEAGKKDKYKHPFITHCMSQVRNYFKEANIGNQAYLYLEKVKNTYL